jgi:hypothetical protein
MTGQINWSDETATWTVTDEYGDIWDVVEIDGPNGLLVREDSQRFYGAEWTAFAGGSDRGELWPRRDGDTYDGAAGAEYEFSEMRGWFDRMAEVIDGTVEDMKRGQA